MVPSRLYLSVLSAHFLLLVGPSLRADTLEITSTPSGATVEINGVARGTTPYREDLPGGYFHRPLTALGKRLEYPMTARIILDGYATRELQLTEGPKEWVSLKGRNHGQYWLLSSRHFHADLDRAADVFTGSIETTPASSEDAARPIDSGPNPELPSKQAITAARRGVVQLNGVKRSGSGFFVTSTGVVVTNAHVARGESSFIATLYDGRKLSAKVIETEEHLDIALLKIEGADFPHLVVLRDLPATMDPVVTIGNPAGAMPGSISRGVVSAVGKFRDAGPGLWVQTDAVINSGNSGGPLLDARGQVIGITTSRIATKNGAGLTLALSSVEIRRVLDRFYGGAQSASNATQMAAGVSEDFGSVVFPYPEGAEIYIDREFHGTAPAAINLQPGSHLVVIRREGHADTIRRITVKKGSHQRLTPRN